MKSFISPIFLIPIYVLLSTLFFKKIYISLVSLFLIGWQGRCRICGLARQVKKWGKVKITKSMWLFFCFSHISLFHSPQTQLQGLQDHLAGVEQHGEFFCCYRKNNSWTFVTFSFEPLKKLRQFWPDDHCQLWNGASALQRLSLWMKLRWVAEVLLCYWTNCFLLDCHRLCINCVYYLC